MAEEQTIREELCEVLDVAQKKKESDEAFVLRLSELAQKLDSDAWEALSTGAQEYMNAVTEADDNKTDIPLFPDEAGADDGDGEPADEAEEEEGDEEMSTATEDEDKPAKKSKKVPAKTAKSEKKAAPAKAAAKDDKPAKKASTRGNGKMSGGIRIRTLVVKKPTMSVDDIEAALKKEGYTHSRVAISATRQSTRDTMRVLIKAGLLKQMEI